jgi:hypothetical protein
MVRHVLYLASQASRRIMEVEYLHRAVKESMIQHFKSHTPSADVVLDPIIRLGTASRTIL